MTDRDALYAAILANPQDNAPRLIYADYIEESGDELDTIRAEFIRLQCERLDQLADDDAAIKRQRTQEILQRYQRKWNREMHQVLLPWAATFRRVDARTGAIRGWRYTRGFISEMTLDANVLVQMFDYLVSHFPIRIFHVFGYDDLISSTAWARPWGKATIRLIPVPYRIGYTVIRN